MGVSKSNKTNCSKTYLRYFYQTPTAIYFSIEFFAIPRLLSIACIKRQFLKGCMSAMTTLALA
jgi:hypothetical protein